MKGYFEIDKARIILISFFMCLVLFFSFLNFNIALDVEQDEDIFDDFPFSSNRYVDDDFELVMDGWGVSYFSKIQDAINASSDGDSIYIYNGTYNENLSITKSIKLIGNNTDSTIINCSNNEECINISNINNVEIKNFTIKNGSKNGILVINCEDVIITNFTIYHFSSGHGIYLNNSNLSNIKNNTIHNTIGYDGIHLELSDNNNIENNEISYVNDDGIGIRRSENNTIYSNICKNNTDDGIEIQLGSKTNIIKNNSVLNNSRNGINLYYNNHHNQIYNNTITNNDQDESGYYGLNLEQSNNNIIYNNFFNNSKNVYDDGSENIWNTTKILRRNIIDGSYLGGNYWSNYNGIDTDTDGLGNTSLPYNNNGEINNGGDYYPLTSKYLSTNIDSITPYEKTSSPITITATGGNYLENVTLYYRHSSTNSSWWNTSWLYRKQLNIANKKDDYQMKIIVSNTTGSNLTCNGHSQSDFDDIRFINISGSEIPFWRENYTIDTQATFWINNTQNDSQIWMYYGNTNVSTTSNGSKTFIHFWDWENTYDGWINHSHPNSDVVVSSDYSKHGNYSLRIVSNALLENARASINIENITHDFALDIWTYPVIYGRGYRFHQIRDRTNNKFILIKSLGVYRSNIVTKYNNSWEETGGHAYQNTWTLITTYVNYSDEKQKHVSRALNESYYTSLWQSTTNNSWTNFNNLTLASGDSSGGGEIYYDAYRIRNWTSNNQPSWNSFGTEEKWIQYSTDQTSPWRWSFTFPNSTEHYEFYSIAIYKNTNETKPYTADTGCYYNPSTNNNNNNQNNGNSVSPNVLPVEEETNEAENTNTTNTTTNNTTNTTESNDQKNSNSTETQNSTLLEDIKELGNLIEKEEISVNITNEKHSGLYQVKIIPNRNLTNVNITVKVHEEKPKNIFVEPITNGSVYRYLDVNLTENGTYLEEDINLTFKFKVSCDWINENKISIETIGLKRYHKNQWEKITTILIQNCSQSEDEYAYFNSEVPGLSTFAVVGGKIVDPEEVKPPKEEGIPWLTIIGIIIVSIIVLLIILIKGKYIYLE